MADRIVRVVLADDHASAVAAADRRTRQIKEEGIAGLIVDLVACAVRPAGAAAFGRLYRDVLPPADREPQASPV
jgi:hypothetical protein